MGSTKLLTQYEADIAHIATHRRGVKVIGKSTP